MSKRNEEDILKYYLHLGALFKRSFEDILKMDKPDWLLNQFSFKISGTSPNLEEELIKLRSNEELILKFQLRYQQL